MSTSQTAVTPCCWGVKAGMVRVWVAGKTVWSPCYTRAISERFRDKELIIKCYINSPSLFFTFNYVFCFGDWSSCFTYLFNEFEVVLNSGVQLLHCCMRYLLEVDAALQTSHCLDWRRHATRRGRPSTEYFQFVFHLGKMCQSLSAASCRHSADSYIWIYHGFLCLHHHHQFF